MFLFWKRKTKPAIDYSKLIIDLQEGNWETIHKHLAFHDSVNYLDAVVFMLAKMQRPGEHTGNLSLYKTVPNGKFELAIFNVPWNTNSPFLPLILNRIDGKIYGVMLPFNELGSKLTKRQKNEIGQLAIVWTGIILEYQMGI